MVDEQRVRIRGRQAQRVMKTGALDKINRRANKVTEILQDFSRERILTQLWHTAAFRRLRTVANDLKSIPVPAVGV
jgi:hypothetical protein